MTLFLKFTTNLRTHFTKVLQSTSERPNKPDLYHEYTENGSHANDIQNLAEGREINAQDPSQDNRMHAALH